MKNFLENIEVNGHLQIVKHYNDGKQEIVFDDHNVIVSGMGVGLAYLYSLTGPDNILNYQIDKFQIGVSGENVTESSSVQALGSQLSSLEEYGENSQMYIVSAYHAYSPTQRRTNSLEAFGFIPQHKVSRVGDSSVRYTIVIDKDTANNLDNTRGGNPQINEIGLFMKNPFGSHTDNRDVSILVAYRKFQGIIKTDDFGLVFKWTINW